MNFLTKICIECAPKVWSCYSNYSSLYIILFSKPFFADQGTSKIEPGVTPRANMTLVGFIYMFSSLFYIYLDIHLHLLLALFEKKNVTQMFTQMIQW